MKQVDRLLIEAKRIACHKDRQLTLAMVELCGASWVASAHLWDQMPGHRPTVESTTHATLEAALEHVHGVAEQYPNSRDVIILIDDVE